MGKAQHHEGGEGVHTVIFVAVGEFESEGRVELCAGACDAALKLQARAAAVVAYVLKKHVEVVSHLMLMALIGAGLLTLPPAAAT